MNTVKDFTEELKYLTKYLEKDEETVLSIAVKKGLDQLYTETIAKLYIEKKLDRAEAIEILGIEAVEDLDYQKKALKEDIEWGLSNG